jgi:hypothetical protein
MRRTRAAISHADPTVGGVMTVVSRQLAIAIIVTVMLSGALSAVVLRAAIGDPASAAPPHTPLGSSYTVSKKEFDQLDARVKQIQTTVIRLDNALGGHFILNNKPPYLLLATIYSCVTNQGCAR